VNRLPKKYLGSLLELHRIPETSFRGDDTCLILYLTGPGLASDIQQQVVSNQPPISCAVQELAASNFRKNSVVCTSLILFLFFLCCASWVFDKSVM
jgi:hypothetical protein